MAIWNDTWTKINDTGLSRYVVAQEWGTENTPLEKLEINHQDLLKQTNHKQLLNIIYDKVKEIGINYNFKKSLLSDEDQLIVKPDNLLNKVEGGACLDLSLLFSGLCLKYDLLPVLIMVKGHAFVAVSLNYEKNGDKNTGVAAGSRINNDGELDSFHENLICKDEKALKRLIDNGAYITIECTGIAGSTTFSKDYPEGIDREDGYLSFERAVNAGREQLDTRDLQFALEIYNLHQRSNFSPFEQGKVSILHELKTGLNNIMYNLGEEELPSIDEVIVNDNGNNEYSLDKMLEENLAELNKLIVLKGADKSGKTTCCHLIRDHFAKEENLPNPIYIPCEELNDSEYSSESDPIHAYINKKILKKLSSVLLEELHSEFINQKEITGQRWILLLDGYFNLKERDKLSKVIRERWLEEYNNITVLLTTTKDVSKETLGTVKSFNLKEIRNVPKVKKLENEKLPILLVLLGTNGISNLPLKKELANEILPRRYSGKAKHWRPYSELRGDEVIEGKTIETLISQFVKLYDYRVIDKYFFGEDVVDENLVWLGKNLKRTVGIIDLLTLVSSNDEKLANKFDRQNPEDVGGIILPFDDNLHNSLKYHIKQKQKDIFGEIIASIKLDKDDELNKSFYEGFVLESDFIPKLRARVQKVMKSIGLYGNRIQGVKDNSVRDKFIN